MTKILLVEDNEENRDMLGRRLSRAGFAVCYACEGEAGIRVAASEMPDVILMDIALGENAMDGWEATKHLKTNPKTSGIPIIALTAHALSTDRQKSIEVGCAEFDTKPVDLERLLRKINACLEARSAA